MSAKSPILVIGANGRLGSALVRRFSAVRPVTGWKRTDLDVNDPAQVRAKLEGAEFGAIIYAAGTTNVDYCEDEPGVAHRCNAESPAVAAEVCAARGARFIHVSTDYVFDGRDPRPLKETDVANPLGEYGRSKLAGERLVLEALPGAVVIRVSWLFGHDRPAFPDMILKNALEKEHVEAIADKVSSPTYSEDLAEWIGLMVDDARYSGLLHLCNSGSCTWQAYGQKVLDVAAAMGLPLKARTVGAVSRKSFPAFKAERPEFTAFDTTKFEQLAGFKPRPWEEALEAYVRRQYAAK